MLLRASAIVTVALISTARADPWRWSATAGTDVPLDIGVGVQLEGPARLRASTTIGIMPGPYVDGINAFLVGVGAYDQDTANLIHAALDNSLIWRTHLGWRPWRAHGFYVAAGYGFVGLGGGATGSEIIEAATGKQLPVTDRGMARTFTCRSMLHMIDAEVGWEWTTGPIVLRAALGGVFTVAASTTIKPDYTPTSPALTAMFTDAGAQYLDTTYTSYVRSPVIAVSAAYPF